MARGRKRNKSQKVAEFVVEAGKEVVITALTTAVAIGVGILMHKDNDRIVEVYLNYLEKYMTIISITSI